MVYLDPMWSKPVKVSEIAMDPLGMKRVSDRITSEMLTGITTMTQRAGYHSFYVWVIHNINESSEITKFSEFAKAFYDRERAFMMSCIAHQESSKNKTLDHSSILSSEKGRRVWRESGNNVDISFRFLANRLGGYGYYYQASLLNLGLILRKEEKDTVTGLVKSLL